MVTTDYGLRLDASFVTMEHWADDTMSGEKIRSQDCRLHTPEQSTRYKNTPACFSFSYFGSKMSFVKVQNALGVRCFFVLTCLVQVNAWRSLEWPRKIFLVWPRYTECLHSSGAPKELYIVELRVCLLLKRLAYLCRYFNLIYRFACPVPELCMIYNIVLHWICINHGHRLMSWNQLFLTPAWLEQYVRAIYQMGCPLT